MDEYIRELFTGSGFWTGAFVMLAVWYAVDTWRVRRERRKRAAKGDGDA